MSQMLRYVPRHHLDGPPLLRPPNQGQMAVARQQLHVLQLQRQTWSSQAALSAVSWAVLPAPPTRGQGLATAAPLPMLSACFGGTLEPGCYVMALDCSAPQLCQERPAAVR